MKIIDEVYGEHIVEGVLEEVIHSKAIQRLKGIRQGGSSYLVNKRWNVTRYEHSIGVMLLIRKLGGSLEEQVAGLLHDVSHTAFSHVIDYVFDEKDEDYHEKIFENVISNSDIPGILTTYNLNEKDILHDISKWTILEQPLPELCADRVDYTLRDMLRNGIISSSEVNHFLKHLIIKDGKIYVNNLEAMEWFVETYYKEVIDYFLNPLNIYGNKVLSETIKRALKKGVLKADDLLGMDAEVIEILKCSNDVEIVDLLSSLNENVCLVEDEKNYDYHMKQKLRIIDPSIFINNHLVKASTISTKIKSLNERACAKAEKGVYIRVV